MGRYFESWITGLDRRRFEVRAYLTGARRSATAVEVATDAARRCELSARIRVRTELLFDDPQPVAALAAALYGLLAG